MKWLWVTNALLLSLMFYLIYEDMQLKHKCRDAGGVPASSVCINPSAVIEVD